MRSGICQANAILLRVLNQEAFPCITQSPKAFSRRDSAMSGPKSLAQYLTIFSDVTGTSRSTALIAAMAAILALVLCAPASYGQANVTGTWQTLPAQMPINPVHTALLSNGKILVVSGSGNYPQQSTFNSGVWDPSNNTITTQLLGWDMFCNGMVVLPDGRPFLMGGNLQYDPFEGWLRSASFNPATGKFVDMEDMAHGRWYPTSTVLGDGRIMTFSGLGRNRKYEFTGGNLQSGSRMGYPFKRQLDAAALPAHAPVA